jgi:hypothetical protein
MIIFIVVSVILIIIFLILIYRTNLDRYIKKNKIKVHPFSEFKKECKTGDLVMITNSHPISKWICSVCEVPFSHILLVIKENNEVGLFEVTTGHKVRLVPFSEAMSESDVDIIGWKKLVDPQQKISTSSFLRVMGKTQDKKYEGKLVSYCLSPFLKKKWVNFLVGKDTYWCTQLIAEVLSEVGIIEGNKAEVWYSLYHFFYGAFRFKGDFGYEETRFVRYY